MALGGKPCENKLSRMLSGVQPMEPDVEEKIHELLKI
jgi:hypothetical protein